MNNSNSSPILDKLITGVLFYLGVYGTLPHIFILGNHNLDLLKPLIIIFFLVLFIYIYKGFNLYSNKTIVLYGIFFSYIFIRSFFLPVTGWDSYSMYDSRAKIFLYGGTYQNLFELSKYDIYNGLYYFSYPPMTSYLNLMAYKVGLTTPMPVYALFYIVFASVLIYWISISPIPKSLKWLIGVVSVFHPDIFPHLNSGYTNLPMLAFQMGAVHILLKNISMPSYKNLVLYSLFLMFSVWTRITEPTYVAFWFAWTLTLNKISNLKTKIVYLILPVLSVLLTRSYWVNFSNIYVRQVLTSSTLDIQISNKIFDALYIGNLLNISQHILYAVKSIFALILVPCFVVALKLIQKKHRILINPLIILWVSLIIIEYLGIVYVSVYYDWWNKIPDSLLRTSLILIPISVLIYTEYHEI